MKPRILVFAGPSGGHLFPAVAYAEELRSRVPEAGLFLVTSRKAETFAGGLPEGLFEKVILWENFPSPSGLSLSSVTFLLKLFTAFVKSIRLFLEVRPRLCAGFGSYVSFPGVVAGKLLRVPVFIHEQNAVPGKATRWAAPFADRVCVSFDRTRGLGRSSRKTVLTGLPLRKFLVDAVGTERGVKKSARQIPPEKMTILVVGGSQGASALNKAFLNTFSLLSPEEKKQIAVIHITGSKEFEKIRDLYAQADVEHTVYPFFDRMNECLEKADLALTRAGANTLFELALFGVPAIVVPYPYAGAHQSANAEQFTAEGALISVPEEKLTAEFLARQIRSFRSDAQRRQEMSSALRRLSKDNAAGQLADLSLQLMKKEATS